MARRNRQLWTGALVCLLTAWGMSFAQSRAAETPTARPNILFILADDLGWRDLSCYGSPFCETPHIDRLAREGLRLTQAYTAGAVCSPTRSSLMTGKYPVRTGVTDYIPGLKKPEEKLLTAPTKTELALEEVTIGEALQQNGYETFYAGKWHLGGEGFEPPQQGFEHYVGDKELGNHGKDWQVGERLTDAALKFLGDRQSDRPFFMYLGFHEPHTPILNYPRHIERFEKKAAALPAAPESISEHDGLNRSRQDDAAYGSEVAGLDEQVGRLLEKLDATKLAANTIVVFFSDNGGLSVKATPGPTCNDPLRAGKGWLYEGGIRVPFIIRAPGLTTANSQCDVPVISTDFYPTLLELTGAKAMPDQHRDGLSLVSLLRGGTSVERKALYWHYPHYHGSTWAPGAALRDGDWKLIELQHYGKVELYNLASDLGERHNVAQQEPEKTRELLSRLHAWQKETGANIPQINPDAESGQAVPLKKSRKKKAP